MSELTIVWQRDRSGHWEYEWIEYLFQNIPHKTIDNLDHSLYIDNSILIESICWAPYHNAYSKEMRRRGLKFGLFHMTDENSITDASSYVDCNFVIRNYYREGLADHVLQVPLGYNSGFNTHTDNNPITDRPLTWSTVLHRWDGNRQQMAQHIQQLPNGKLYVADQSGPRLEPADMSRIYRDSIFVICPNGALTPDSFRVTEALQAGCIPIVQKSDYWFKSYGSDFPAIQIDNWATTPSVIVDILLNPKTLEEKRLECDAWWTKTKDKSVQAVTDLYNRTMK
jgi:hypothetical protein